MTIATLIITKVRICLLYTSKGSDGGSVRCRKQTQAIQTLPIQIVSIKSIGRDVLRALVFGIDAATDVYKRQDYVCPFAVRVPAGLRLADFLGSMITRTIGLF